MPAHQPRSSGSFVANALRLAWAAQVVIAPAALAAALGDRSVAVRTTVLAIWWAAWFAGLVATLVPATASLTLLRLVTPLAPLLALGALVTGDAAGGTDTAGRGTVGTTIALIWGVAVAALAFSAEVGELNVQGSAYGDERRFPLRPPGTLLAGPLAATWLVSVGLTVIGVIAIAASRPWLGGAATVIGVALLVLLVPRFHLLARRWLVFVPAGLVVHDHVPLSETVMVGAGRVDRLDLAPVDHQAIDLTAGALGSAIEVTLRTPMVVARRSTRRSGSSESVEAASLLVSPSRPGRVIAQARQRGW